MTNSTTETPVDYTAAFERVEQALVSGSLPKPGLRYFAHMIWTYTENDELHIVSSSFSVGDDTLPNSRWLDECMLDFVTYNSPMIGTIYQFDGVFYIDPITGPRFEGSTSVCEVVRKDFQTWKQ